jgi:hypothetical protein
MCQAIFKKFLFLFLKFVSLNFILRNPILSPILYEVFFVLKYNPLFSHN